MNQIIMNYESVRISISCETESGDRDGVNE